MKLTVSMKDPDTLHDAIREAVSRDIARIGLTDAEEVEALAEVRHTAISNICAQWFKYGEYLTVEIDTEANTCTVVKS